MVFARKILAAGSTHSIGELSHGIEIMMLNFLNIFFLLVLAVVFGCFKEVAIAALVYICIRSFTGGVHFSNPWSCLLVGNILLFATGWGTAHLLSAIQPSLVWGGVLLSWLLGYTINDRYAPVPNMYFKFNPTQIQKNRIRALRLIRGGGAMAVLLGIVGCLSMSLTITLTILLQSILLHPVTFSIVKKLRW